MRPNPTGSAFPVAMTEGLDAKSAPFVTSLYQSKRLFMAEDVSRMDAVNDNIQMECGRRAIDIFVGGRLTTRRVELGLEQSDLADDIRTSPEQIDAYERGIERVTSDHLVEFTKILGVKLVFFFTEPLR